MKGFRKAGVRSLEAANQYLEQHYLELWNERFTVTPARMWMPTGHSANSIA